MPTVVAAVLGADDTTKIAEYRVLGKDSAGRPGLTDLQAIGVVDEVRTAPPDAVDLELVLVDGQLAPQVRPVLVAEAAVR